MPKHMHWIHWRDIELERASDLVLDYYSNFSLSVSARGQQQHLSGTDWKFGVITDCTHRSASVCSVAKNMLLRSAEPECQRPHVWPPTRDLHGHLQFTQCLLSPCLEANASWRWRMGSHMAYYSLLFISKYRCNLLTVLICPYNDICLFNCAMYPMKWTIVIYEMN